jgi:hypothetical protein
MAAKRLNLVMVHLPAGAGTGEFAAATIIADQPRGH